MADTAPETSDVLIIGAGPSGSIAGALLCRKGHSCIILERDIFPRFSIGESLLPQCMEFLDEADMLDSVREMQFQAKEGALFSWGSQLSSFDFSDQFLSEVWTGTYEVERAVFDSTLARRAEELGATILFGHEIIDAAPKAEACEVVALDGNGVEHRYRARFVLDASGFGRVLPRLLKLDCPSSFPARRSLFTHVQDRIEHVEFDRNKILITIHPENTDIWYWLIPFSNGRSSIGVVASEDCLDGFESSRTDTLKGLVKADPRLSAMLKHAVFDSPVSEISGYSANVKRLWGDGFALLGNAGEFLDPIFSSGVTIAMKSASLAATALDRQLRGEPVDWDDEFARPLKRGVDVFRAFVESWYDGVLHDIIFAKQKDAKIKRMICSILAGYVWDKRNPYVSQTRKRLSVLAELCRNPSR